MTRRTIAPTVRSAQRRPERGFSLIEMVVAMAVLTVLLGAMMTFISRMQERYTSEQRMSGVNQGGKTAMDLLSIDIAQAGFPPVITRELRADITGSGSGTYAVDSADGLYIGRLIMIDDGARRETVALTGVDKTSKTITGVFKNPPHMTGAKIRVTAYPYPQGIIMSTVTGASTSGPNTLKLFGDIRGDGNLRYIEYRYTPPVGNTPGVLVRSDSDAFAASEEPAVTVVDNLWDATLFNYTIAMGTCPGTLPAGVAGCTPTPSAGSYVDLATGATVSFVYVMNVGVTMTMQTQTAIERNAGAGGVRQMVIRQQYFMPRNVVNALYLSQDGLMTLLPVAPTQVTGMLGM